MKKRAELAGLAVTGAEFLVRVIPGASADTVEVAPDGSGLRIRVTAVPENGKANAAVKKVLARAPGVAKSRLLLVRGQTGRDKLFRLD